MNSHAVSYEQALQELNTLLDDFDSQTRGSNRRTIANYYTSSVTSTRSNESDEDAPFVYIFNFENEEGFAIISGDDRVTPLLALTYDGSLIPGDTIDNPGLAIFLSRLPGYFEEQISAMAIFTPPTDIEPYVPANYTGIMFSPWDEIARVAPYMVGGYCQVHWHQNAPYNQFVNGKTGCVPVAVGQLMSMYKHPASYNDYTFDWTEIVKSPSTASGNQQAARLLQQLGLRENLNEDGNTVSKSIKRTLEHFGYTCQGDSDEDYNINTIVRELKNGYPCLVGGASSKITILGIPFYSGHHEWLVHGLITRTRTLTPYEDGVRGTSWVETEHYLLCNMGWGSARDGYYLSKVFDTNNTPNITRSGVDNYYHYDLNMATGIRINN